MRWASLRRKLGRLGRNGERDRGAVFVEFALAVPFLVIVALGIVEYGIGWQVANDVNAAARDAARAAAMEPTAQVADRTVLDIIANQLDTDDGDYIEKVIVFKVSSGSGTVPNECTTITVSNTTPGSPRGIANKCNVYGPKQLAWVKANPTNTTNIAPSASNCNKSTYIDELWCPVTRNRSLYPNTSDYFGVYIKFHHKNVTGAGFGDRTVERSAIFRLEPNFGGT